MPPPMKINRIKERIMRIYEQQGAVVLSPRQFDADSWGCGVTTLYRAFWQLEQEKKVFSVRLDSSSTLILYVHYGNLLKAAPV